VRVGLPLPWGIVPAERLFRVVVGADPPPGQEWSVTVPGGAVWEVLSITAVLTTDATVTSRGPRAVMDDGSVIFAAAETNSAHPASTSRRYVWIPDLGTVYIGTSSALVHVPLPRLTLLPGHRIRSFTYNMQAGDNWEAPVLYVAEYQIRGLERAVERYREALEEVGMAEG
jgi:hypothetical protein